MNFKKTSIAALVVLFLLVGFVAWRKSSFFTNREESATPSQPATQEPSSPDVSSWKTYRNEEYGFEVKYPPAWSVYEQSGLTEIFDDAPPDKQSFDVAYGGFNINFWSRFTKGAHEPFFDLSLDQMIQEFNPPTIETEENTLLDGVPAKTSSGFRGLQKIITVVAKESGNFFWISMEPVGSNQNLSEATLNTILSTFTFIGPASQIDTSNWKTYRGQMYEFRYPQDWQIVANGKIAISYREAFLSISVREGSNERRLPIEEWFRELLMHADPPPTSWEKIIFKGRPAIRAELPFPNETATFIFIENNNDIVEISYKILPEYDKKYNEILSTFKFIE